MARQYRTDSRKILLAMSESDFANAVSMAYSWNGLRKSLGDPTMKSIEDLISERSLSVSHFTGKCWNKGRRDLHRNPDEVLVLGKAQPHFVLKRALLEKGRPYLCEGLIEFKTVCLLVDEWNGVKLSLQIDHIDGDGKNNLEANLRFLCPNCHSQTLTFGNRSEGIAIRKNVRELHCRRSPEVEAIR